MFLAFIKIVAITTGIVWGLMALPLYWFAEPTITWAAVVGCLLSALCYTAGFYAVCRSIHDSNQTLMLMVVGGMVARLLFIGAMVVLVVTLTSLHVASFLGSLLGFYIVYLAIELYVIKTRYHSWEGSVT